MVAIDYFNVPIIIPGDCYHYMIIQILDILKHIILYYEFFIGYYFYRDRKSFVVCEKGAR